MSWDYGGGLIIDSITSILSYIIIDCMFRPCSDTFTIFDGTQLGAEILAITGPSNTPPPPMLNIITTGLITVVFTSDSANVDGGVFMNVAL